MSDKLNLEISTDSNEKVIQTKCKYLEHKLILPQIESKLTTLASINYENQLLNLINRNDKYGTPIIKNKKQHKVTFSDQFVNERVLAQVNKVESYKLYNTLKEESHCFNCIFF